MTPLHVVVVALAIALSSPLEAGEVKPRHGGVVKEVREVSYELVARPDAIAIYVSDHGKKIATEGATAKVTLLQGNDKTEVVLSPAGDNKLEAKGNFAVQKGLRIVAVVTLAGRQSATARYEIK